MGEMSLAVDDCILLKLMDKYKPHLKPYAYRQDAWYRVLEDYNEKTGNLYRQIRTLKTKFNRMKVLCNDENSGIAVGDLELLRKLVGESDSATTHRARRKRRTRSPALEIDSQQDALDAIERSEVVCGDEGHPSDHDDDAAELAEEANDATQPPPLDSITMGFSLANTNNTSSPSLGLASGQPPVEAGERTSADAVGDLKPFGSSGQNYDAEIYKHLITSLTGILSRKRCMSEVVTNQDLVTVDKLYTELREYQRTEQQFREEVLHRLDTIIAHLGNRENFPD
ncbi:hypothetical protein HG536_0E02480 [Torulaspora globosa]|uniref:Myb/SANT-like DNA-binding domain-containing protein n=1 Tax=Torulaspora globosa TaxID=48254 RepID=A0A7G3ZIK1_9SACH|nr:uncharacterized protein HG536_0E02480 [Torulaspora globosa]QLL33337.1 hypothetical protein HG536_0E02480 [Torulaspora globosa]